MNKLVLKKRFTYDIKFSEILDHKKVHYLTNSPLKYEKWKLDLIGQIGIFSYIYEFGMQNIYRNNSEPKYQKLRRPVHCSVLFMILTLPAAFSIVYDSHFYFYHKISYGAYLALIFLDF